MNIIPRVTGLDIQYILPDPWRIASDCNIYLASCSFGNTTLLSYKQCYANVSPWSTWGSSLSHSPPTYLHRSIPQWRRCQRSVGSYIWYLMCRKWTKTWFQKAHQSGSSPVVKDFFVTCALGRQTIAGPWSPSPEFWGPAAPAPRKTFRMCMDTVCWTGAGKPMAADWYVFCALWMLSEAAALLVQNLSNYLLTCMAVMDSPWGGGQCCLQV